MFKIVKTFKKKGGESENPTSVYSPPKKVFFLKKFRLNSSKKKGTQIYFGIK